jgi:hypothetical protein
MKNLRKILGIAPLSDQEKKVLQQLRDEAVQEKANDELTETDKTGISDTLNALREKGVEKYPSIPSWHLPPTWAIGLTCLACGFLIYFPSRQNPPSSPKNQETAVLASASLNQRVQDLTWTEDVLGFEVPSIEGSLALPPLQEWIEKPKLENLHTILPIGSSIAFYEELSQPSLPSFEIPKVSEQAFELYLQEGRLFKNNLQNDFDEMVESIGSIDLGIEG